MVKRQRVPDDGAGNGMRTGLLWFDDSPNVPLSAKVERAARRYRERIGRAPDVCYVHPQTLAAAKEMPADVQVVESVKVRPNYFWIGVKPR
jgi:hypothetical protein